MSLSSGMHVIKQKESGKWDMQVAVVAEEAVAVAATEKEDPRMVKAFRKLDVDGDGHVTLAEVFTALQLLPGATQEAGRSAAIDALLFNAIRNARCVSLEKA